MADPIPSPQSGDQDPPASPKTVKATTGIKTPREIQLEKKVSVLEDKVGGLESAVEGINEFLETAIPTGKPVKPSAKADAKNPLDELMDFFTE